ncbi:MAG: hypothetical protein ACTSPD_14560 [Promethearchaeota archaeon]
MEVLELKPVKKKKVIAYMFAKDNSEKLQNSSSESLIHFLKEKKINFLTLDFDIDMKKFKRTTFAKTLDTIGINYYQLDIPEYPMGYLYQEILEKEEFLKELIEEYKNLENRESYKALSMKNWIDLINMEIQEKEINLSLTLRPLWIVKKMLDLVRTCAEEVVSFVHIVQTDICEDICPQVAENLRELNVKVIQYNKKHTIKNIII